MLTYFSFKCYSIENCFLKFNRQVWKGWKSMQRRSLQLLKQEIYQEIIIPEDLTTNPSELLQTVKDLKTEMGLCKARK